MLHEPAFHPIARKQAVMQSECAQEGRVDDARGPAASGAPSRPSDEIRVRAERERGDEQSAAGPDEEAIRIRQVNE